MANRYRLFNKKRREKGLECHYLRGDKDTLNKRYSRKESATTHTAEGAISTMAYVKREVGGRWEIEVVDD